MPGESSAVAPAMRQRAGDAAEAHGDARENSYRFLIECLPHIVWSALPDGGNNYCNPQWTAYTGLSAEATRGDGWMNALHPDERPRVMEWWRGCLAGTGRHDIRYRLRRTDGSYRWHFARAMPIRNPEGNVTKWIGNVIDIHDQVEAEAQLQASDAKYRNLVEMSSDAIYIRMGSTIVFANAATARIYGVATPEELLGKSPLSFVHPDYIEALKERWHKLETKRKPLPPYEAKLILGDGSMIDVESVASPIDYQGQPAAHVVLRDISERKALQQRKTDLLKEQAAHAQAAALAEHFELLAEAVPNMVWTTRPDGYLDYVNQRVLDYMDCTFGDIEGHGWVKFVHPEDLPTVQSRWAQSLATGSAFEVEERFRRGGDGAYRWHIARALPVRDADYHVVTWVGTCVDIDDQKHAQALLSSSRARLEQAVVLRTRELLLANSALRISEGKLRNLSAHLQSARETERASIAREIHDELGASLTAVKMDLTRYVKTFHDIPAASRDLLAEVASLVDSAIQTVRRIATQLRPSILDHLGLWPALEWQLEEFENRYSVQCSIELDAMPAGLDKDAQTAVFRIVQEALTNVARHSRATRVHVKVTKVGEHVRIDITDNGIGIPAEKLSDPTSCGIQGMHERAEAFGGRIQLESNPADGTRLYIDFPLRPAAARRVAGEA
ncbi:MAG TPA: PAS domain-containing protein [Burkholderiales bacterium]